MSAGSGATRVLAVLLFTAAIVFAAGAVPSLAAHSPGGGLDEVTNVSAGAAQDGAAPPGGGGPVGAQGGSAGPSPAGGGDLTVPERMATLFGSLLEMFGGGSLGGAGGGGPLGGAGVGGGASPPSDVDVDNPTPGTDGATPTPPPASGASPTAEPTATSEDDESGIAGPGSRGMGIVVVVVAALLLAVYVYRSDRGPLAALTALPDHLRALFVGVLLGVSNLVERAVRRLGEVRSVLELPGLLVDALREAMRSLRADLARSVPMVGGEAAAAGGVAGGDEGETVPARQQIRGAWREVVETVAPGRYRTSTPGDIEREAVDRGLPAAAVGALADAFRAVEYGGRDAEDRVESATDAATTVRDHIDQEDE